MKLKRELVSLCLTLIILLSLFMMVHSTRAAPESVVTPVTQDLTGINGAGWFDSPTIPGYLLRYDGFTFQPTSQALMKIDLSAVPTLAIIEQARLYLAVHGPGDSGCGPGVGVIDSVITQLSIHGISHTALGPDAAWTEAGPPSVAPPLIADFPSIITVNEAPPGFAASQYYVVEDGNFPPTGAPPPMGTLAEFFELQHQTNPANEASLLIEISGTSAGGPNLQLYVDDQEQTIAGFGTCAPTISPGMNFNGTPLSEAGFLGSPLAVELEYIEDSGSQFNVMILWGGVILLALASLIFIRRRSTSKAQ